MKYEMMININNAGCNGDYHRPLELRKEGIPEKHPFFFTFEKVSKSNSVKVNLAGACQFGQLFHF